MEEALTVESSQLEGNFSVDVPRVRNYPHI